jgi:hypothetical protein
MTFAVRDEAGNVYGVLTSYDKAGKVWFLLCDKEGKMMECSLKNLIANHKTENTGLDA